VTDALRFTINGRFLGVSSPTGIQRVARSLLAAALPTLGSEASVIAPHGVGDALVNRCIGRSGGPLTGLAWEQVTLPVAARRSVTVSLANTGPLLATGGSAILIHDLAPLTNPEWFHWRMGMYARIALAASRRADLVFVVSHHVADVLTSRGVSAHAIHVVEPCVDPMFTPADPVEVGAVLARLGIEPPYVVHVGAEDPRKNAALLIRCHLSIVDAHPHQLVLVGGRHPNLAPVELSKAPSIRAVGRLDEPSLRAVLTGAAALGYPSLDEGFGLPPLEAQACGTPALVSDIPVLRETSGPTALRIDVDDVDGWTAALLAAIGDELEPPTVPSRQWAESASVFLDALRELR
jgi:glycosyltransferase involved in cell wall biosynthesis